MRATPANPIVFRFTGKIPALKNSKIPIALKGGRGATLTMNPKVRQWLIAVNPSLQDQWQRQQTEGYEHISLPERVVMVFYWHIYAAKETSVPQADLDNAAASVQEILQSPKIWKQKAGKMALAIDVYDDDRQLVARWDEQVLVANRALEGGTVYLWPDRLASHGEGRIHQLTEFLEHKSLIDGRLTNESELPELVLEGL